MIADALQKVGAARSIVIDEDNVILAGNGVTEAAAEAGITKLRVIDAAGDELIAVRRTGLTPEQKRHLAIADNRGAELATWNVEQLATDLANGEDLTAFFFDEEVNALGLPTDGSVSQDPENLWQGMPECTSDDLSAWKSIRLNFGSADALKAFSELIGQPMTENTRSIWYPAAEIGRYADKRYVDEP